eukprot:5001561-Pyramimonas_sp.AAC.1
MRLCVRCQRKRTTAVGSKVDSKGHGEFRGLLPPPRTSFQPTSGGLETLDPAPPLVVVVKHDADFGGAGRAVGVGAKGAEAVDGAVRA